MQSGVLQESWKDLNSKEYSCTGIKEQAVKMDSGFSKSEDDLIHLEAKSDSFWDIGNYQRVVKRIESGARLCGDFVKMAQERAEIEGKYSRSLQQWSKRWEELVSKGAEYGSMEVGWKACLNEANQVADVHAEVCSKIQHDITNSIHIWKGNHFHKSLRGLKETKKAEENFSQAQKPWLKRLQKSTRSRKSYHKAAYDLEILQGRLRVAETSAEISPEQCAKTREKCEQAESTFDKALDKYKLRLGELQHYQARYIEDLTMQFNKCQEAEQARMEFFKQTLQSLKQALDIHSNQSIPSIYTEYEETLSRMSPEDDLREYAINHGTGMSYTWPDFEPYTSSQTSSKSSTLSSTHRNSPAMNYSTSGQTHTVSGGGSSGGTQSRRSEHSSLAGSSSSNSPGLNSKGILDQEAGYDSGDEDDWMEPPPPVGDSPDGLEGKRHSSEEPQGHLMRAVYDYSGSQEDDLCFKEGDMVRVMYEGKDGWAEAMMADKYGYVPISYLEPCAAS